MTDKKEKLEKLITRSDLKNKMGWTDGMIKRFLPNPDEIKPNPIFRSASAMKLYSIDRIQNIEITEEFKNYKNRAIKFKSSSKKSVETKRENALNWVSNLNISIPVIERNNLIKLAVDHYNQIQFDRDSCGLSSNLCSATTKSDLSFLERISVNYLRHCMTDYDYFLETMYGRVGINDIYFKLRDRIFQEISNKYPWLKQECKRQNGDIVKNRENRKDSPS